MSEPRVATGLYVNWDSIVRVDEAIFRWIEKTPKTEPSGVILKTQREAAFTLAEALRVGGSELLTSKTLYRSLDRRFKERRWVLGGNGYHMGNALLGVGLRPIVSYPLRSRRIMEASPSFHVAAGDRLRPPLKAVREGDRDYDHIVFEFNPDPSKGVPEAGRHIFSYDPMSNGGVFDRDFLEYVADRGAVDVLVLGYAHLLLPRVKRRTELLLDHLDNPHRPKTHLELGLGSEESVRYAMKRFADRHCSDSWGMNEKECALYLDAESEGLEDLAEAASRGVKGYGLSRLCVHTPNFAFALTAFDPQKEVEALRAGCIAGATQTLGGLKRSPRRVEALTPSPVKRQVRKLGRHHLCITPTFINPSPKTTTGLGDAFAAVYAYNVLGRV